MVKLERQGFTISIDELDFFIPMSSENFVGLFDIDERIKEKSKIFQEKLKEIVGNEKKLTADSFKKTIALKKEYLTDVYDSILGEGSFEKLYTYHPYVDDLIETLMTVADEYVRLAKKFSKDQRKKEEKLIREIKKKKGKK